MTSPANLIGKQFCVVGLKNSGKTNFVKWLLRDFYSRHVVFDPKDEYKDEWGWNQYVPGNKRSNAELDLFIDQFVKPNKSTIDVLVVDESNRYHQKGGELKGPIAEIVDWGTSHWNMGAGFVARRPKQVHTDILELSEYIFVHRLTGENDMKKLRNIHPNLPGEVQKISGPEGQGDYPQYSCIMVTPGRNLVQLPPPPEMQNDKPTS